MARRSPTSIQLSLIAALFGLSALLLGGAAQGSSKADQHLFRGDAPGLTTTQRAALPGRESVLPGHSRYGSHPLPRSFAAAPLPGTLRIVTPEFAASLLARENARSLATASRTTGPSRAPPAG